MDVSINSNRVTIGYRAYLGLTDSSEIHLDEVLPYSQWGVRGASGSK